MSEAVGETVVIISVDIIAIATDVIVCDMEFATDSVDGTGGSEITVTISVVTTVDLPV